MTFLRCLLIFILSVKCFAQQDTVHHLETMAFQKDIISKLTGVAPIDGEKNFLSQRSSPKERVLTTAFLNNQLREIGVKSEEQHYTTTNSNILLDLFYAPIKGINVVGELSATVPSNTYVILGAHYDTERTSPGAIDNATGIALILDVAKRIARLKVRNVNFLLVFFDQEEDNEVGSREFVKMLAKTDKEVESVHIFDLIGWDSNGNKRISLQSPPAFLEKAYRDNALDLNIPIQIIPGASSDNKSFLKEGYQTILISDEVEDVTPYYHTAKDDMNTVDFDYLALVSNLVYKTLKAITDE